MSSDQPIRKILHLDLDAFFCSVEEQHNSALRGKAFAVGGKPDSRGVVASCSYPARQFGIRSAMPMSQAVRRCPHLIIVPANHRAYGEMSRRVMQILHDLTPSVEQLSIDEAFLDVTDLPGSAEDIARQLQTSIREKLNLPSSLGVATNKLVAKIANNVGKAEGREINEGKSSPNAIKVIEHGAERDFLDPLPCRELWGVGPRMAESLKELGMHTIGDIARWPEGNLEERFGKIGAALALRSKGIDDRPISTERESKSVSQETTFTRDVADEAKLLQTLKRLSDGVASSLRRKKLKGTTVRLKIRWSDFSTPSRQLTLPRPTDDPQQIYAAAEKLFKGIWPDRKPVRLLGVGISGFDEKENPQISLWEMTEMIRQEENKSDEEKRLDQALAELRKRFGESAILRGSELDSNESKN